MAPMPINDSFFLLMERREQPMHVGALQIFDFPPEADSEWLAGVYESLADEAAVERLAPAFRKQPNGRLAPLGPWAWQEDEAIDLEHHIRHSCLPRPGRVRELLALVSQLHGTLLDRSRPLWEAHLIDGLDDGRFALYSKVHHSMVDGVAALRLVTRSLSTDPDERSMPMPWERPVAEELHGDDPAGQPVEWLSALTDLSATTLRTAVELAELGPTAARSLLAALVDQTGHLPALAPRTILNQSISGSRRFAAESWPLERLRAVARATATTINDVVLAMCGGALRSYLADLGALPDESLIALTPVSLRREDEDDTTGNAIGALLCTLATDQEDPAARLIAVHGAMEAGKSYLRGLTRAQALLTSALSMAPMLMGQIPVLRDIAPPGCNVMISNVPGPSGQLYWNGARLDGMYPLSVPAHGHALNITALSYNASMELGLVGCRRTVPRLQRLLAYLADSLAALEAAVA